MNTKFMLTLLLLSLACTEAYAAGAPWFKWKNRVDRTILCAQVSPGSSWVQYQGPFSESRCKKAGVPH